MEEWLRTSCVGSDWSTYARRGRCFPPTPERLNSGGASPRSYLGPPTHHLTSRNTWGQKPLQMILDPSPVTLSECTMLTSFPDTANATSYGGHSRVRVQLSGDSGVHWEALGVACSLWHLESLVSLSTRLEVEEREMTPPPLLICDYPM